MSDAFVESLKSCGHIQCILCWRRECQLRKKIEKFGQYHCCEDCLRAAVSIAYAAATTLGARTPEERPCGRD
jgi:hypothetical protein